MLATTLVVLAENVVTLTSANFQKTLDSNEFVLVEFYAPWCGHCKSLAPEYESAATTLKNEGASVVLAKVDATAEKDISEGVTGFPTLKFYVSGKPFEFTGGRTADSIVSWLKKKTGPAVTKLETQAELDAAKEANPVLALLVGASDAFETAAKGLEIPFFQAVGELKQSLGKDAVVVHKHFDEFMVELEDFAAATAASVATFVESHSLPLVVPFSQETAQKIFGGQVKQHFILFVDKAGTGVTEVVKTAGEVAKKVRGEYLFVTVDRSDSRVIDFFGIKEFPDARVVELTETGMRKYKLVGDAQLTADNIQKTIDEHKAGNLKVDLKSEEVPEGALDGDVKVLVGKNFDSVVKQAGKDVFVEFYAPWCGHCKQLAPKYDELGAWAKTKPNLIVAKIDASQNEVASVDVTSFPTLKLFLADSNEIVDYSGERELADMIAFLEKHATSCAAATA
ncbi:protein disulfide-isomerase domain [Batrachochytrium salamandrivorans]|nr:protein disulfide-isomerase domain [Batrachochytrium salamandrivorans]